MTGVGTDQRWVRRYRPAPDAVQRLVCLPHAGGSASFYLPAAHALAPRVDVLAVQYPGRQDRRGEPCVESIPELADHIAEVLRDWADLPLSLFGHSMGATLGFEVARRLEASGVRPAVLFASGRRAPSRLRDERHHLLDDAGLLAAVRELGGSAPELFEDDEVRRMVLPAIRSDYRAVETYRYRPGPPLSCPIVALTGDADPKVTVPEARAWAEHTDSSFALHVFPGGHFYLTDRFIAVMDVITERLAVR
ncbi:thioesterase II family protein [Actinomadura rugatobispora]|uniref:Thioesterase II family protein n=1 Tax=Actinomadura rugatobispora TaxID=1994 RepID=A0ABW1A9B9_9ACTN